MKKVILALFFIISLVASGGVYYFYYLQNFYTPFVLISTNKLYTHCISNMYSITRSGNQINIVVPAYGIQFTSNSYVLPLTRIMNFTLHSLYKSYITNSSNIPAYLENKSTVITLPNVVYPISSYFLLEVGGYPVSGPIFPSYQINSFPYSTVLSLNVTPYKNSIYNYKFNIQFQPPPPGNLFNYLDGARYMSTLYYFGVTGNTIASDIPFLSKPNGWSLYYYQQALVLTTASQYRQGMALFNYSYSGKGNITILLIGGFGSGSTKPADGFEIYFFMKLPNPLENRTLGNNKYYLSNPSASTQLLNTQGLLVFPYSNSPYFMVQWDPYYIESGQSSTKEYNLFIVTPNPDGSVSKSNIKAIGPLGQNGWGISQTKNFFYLCMKATYDPSTGWLWVETTNLQTGQTATLSYNVGITNIPPGEYTFAIAGNTGGEYANWGIVYATIY